jgi:hypothetical protein
MGAVLGMKGALESSTYVRSGFHEPRLLARTCNLLSTSGMSFRDFRLREREPKLRKNGMLPGDAGKPVECHSLETGQLYCPYVGTRAHSAVYPAGNRNCVPLVAIQE